jgi:hypothetical protein
MCTAKFPGFYPDLHYSISHFQIVLEFSDHLAHALWTCRECTDKARSCSSACFLHENERSKVNVAARPVNVLSVCVCGSMLA